MSDNEGTAVGTSATPVEAQGKRADARRNIESILDAATVCLARDPNASVSEIAQEAGVGRVTLYGHFESRAALVTAVTRRAIEDTESALGAVDLDGDPAAAMSRLVAATWTLTRRYGALVVAAEQVVPEEEMLEAHRRPMLRVERLLRRGRRSGVFRRDMPLDWQVATIQGLLHGASQALYRGQITEAQAPDLLTETVLAVVTPRH